MTEVDRSPARLSGWASVGAAFVALASSGFYSWGALAVGTLGLLFLAVGLTRSSNAGVTLGASGLFVGAVVAGARGAPVAPTLLAVTAAVLAWDAGGTAISVGRQLGREADARRLETIHLTASAVVGAATATLGYGLYLAGTGDQPVAALVLLLVAAVLLVEALG